MNRTVSRRGFLQAGVLGAGAAALAACGATPAAQPATQVPTTAATAAGAEPTVAAASPATEGPTNVTWIVLPEDPRRAWYKYCTDTVPQQNPGITLELIEVTWTEYETKINAMLAAGTPVDLWCQWGTNNFVDYTYKGMTLPVGDLIDAENVDLSDFFPRWIEENKINGKLVGLPVYAGGSYVFYNADLLDAAGIAHPPTKWSSDGWTLDDFLANATALTKDYGNFEKGIYGDQGHLELEDMCWGFGGEVWPKEAYRGIATEILLDAPENIEAIQWWADLVCKHKVAPDPEAAGALEQAGIGGLAGGRAAMVPIGVWGFNQAVAVESFKWGVAAVPKGKSLKVGIYADPIMIARTTEHPQAAFKAMLVITGDQALKELSSGSLWPSPRQSHLDLWAGKVIEKGSVNTADEAKECILGSWEYGQYAPMNDIAGYSQKTWDVVISGLDPVWKCETPAAELLPQLKTAEDAALAELKFSGVPW